MDKIRVAVVGAGKMGSIHAKVYDQLPHCEFVGVVDTNAEKAEQLAKQYNVSAFGDCADLLGKVDAVTISAPTVLHQKLASIFIENKIAVMIEKPLAATVKEGKKIVKLAQKNDVVVAVGHSERCNPVVQAMQRLEIEPKYIEASRISPYPFRSMDIGVVLDVMIHDIDIILSLAASKIKNVEAVGVNVMDDNNEDICNARIVFENGCTASITASRLAFRTERKVRVYSRQGYLSLDFFKKTGIIIKPDPNIDIVNKLKEQIESEDFDPQSTNWADLLHVEKLAIEDKEPLRLEQESFLKAVADRSMRPEVTGEDGLAALECADKILRSVRKHKWD